MKGGGGSDQKKGSNPNGAVKGVICWPVKTQGGTTLKIKQRGELFPKEEEGGSKEKKG